MNDDDRSDRLAQPIGLDDSERQRCEVWTRVMGYHRPVASFNIGKKGEHHERRFFREACARLDGTAESADPPGALRPLRVGGLTPLSTTD